MIAGDTITVRRPVLPWRADRVFYTTMSIAVAGAVFAGWPAVEARRRADAAYAARVGRELKRT